MHAADLRATVELILKQGLTIHDIWPHTHIVFMQPRRNPHVYIMEQPSVWDIHH